VKLEESEFQTDRSIMLTDYAIDTFFHDSKDLFILSPSKKNDLIQPEDIVEKELFFNPKEQRSLDFLFKALSQDSFKSIQERISIRGMNKGMCILFYGYAGCGKSESVLQLGKTCNRPIKIFDLSIRDKFYGESEKALKRLFSEYGKMTQNGNNVPILCLNEADALIGSRLHNGITSIDRIERTLMDILLDEMDKFTGIMICTTNIHQAISQDPAFLRRFHIKVEFKMPTKSVRKQIWQNLIPTLNDLETDFLANRYEISPAQISNVIRKFIMQQVLYGTNPSVDELDAYCKEEFIDKGERRKIGFNR